MKRTAKTIAALLLAGAMAVLAVSNIPASALDTAPAVPEWVPDSYEDVIGFLNDYGFTHVDDYICIIRPKTVGDGKYYHFEASGLQEDDLISDETYSVKAEDPGKDDGSEEYWEKYRAYENYKRLLDQIGERGINSLPEYEVLTFLPDTNGQIYVQLIAEGDTFVETAAGDVMSVRTKDTTDYSFLKDENGCTETDVYGWLPDSVGEFDHYVNENKTVSLHDQYVVVCTEVNHSTGADLIAGQYGAAYTKSHTESIPFRQVEPDYLTDGNSSRTVTLYTPKEEGRAVFTQFVGRTFDDSIAKISCTGVKAEKDGKNWTLSLVKPVLYDLNADGMFSKEDVCVLEDHLTGRVPLNDAQFVMADCKFDKHVDAKDLSLLKNMLLYDDTEEPVPDVPVSEDTWPSAPDMGGGWSYSEPASPSASGTPGTSIKEPNPADPFEPIFPDPYIQPSSKVLTAGEWNDNENWDFFAELVHDNKIQFPTYGLNPVYRIALTLTQNGEPVANQQVTLTGTEKDWTAVTDRNGIVYLFYTADDIGKDVTVEAGGQTVLSLTIPEEESDQEGYFIPTLTYTAELDADTTEYTKAEVMFILDTTGSMTDEMAFLQKDFTSIAKDVDNGNISFSVNFYRDEGDDYVTRCNPFTDDVNEIVEKLNAECADGGGDLPEAVAQILYETLVEGDWHDGTNKIAFLIFDAPPHKGAQENEQIAAAVAAAAEKGIHVVPVVASNADRNTELFARALSIMTNANYVFLTDDSGVGSSHLEPIIGDYEVELLHDIIVRNILEIAGGSVPETEEPAQ